METTKCLSPAKVLLVDDEEDFVTTVGKRLAKRGLDISTSRSGEEALEFLADNDADVVVLDVKMPGIGGMETLKRIKHDHPLVEVILLSGHADMESAVQGMELGAFDYLMKPMKMDELLYKIEDAFTKKQLHRAKISQARHVAEKHH